MNHTKNDHSPTNGSNIITYIIGFILSIILTIIPFWIVMNGSVDKVITIKAILLTAVAQILVHFICFLHINIRSNEGWNFTTLIFTTIIISILMIGSIWIMWNLNNNMMIH